MTGRLIKTDICMCCRTCREWERSILNYPLILPLCLRKMGVLKGKATLKSKLPVDVKSRSQLCLQSRSFIVDAAAMVWSEESRCISCVWPILPVQHQSIYICSYDLHRPSSTQATSECSSSCLSVSKSNSTKCCFNNLTNPDTAPDTLEHNLVVTGSDFVQV